MHPWQTSLKWGIMGGVAVSVAFWVRSPYLAFAAYSFLLLVVLAKLSSRAWLAGLDCDRTLSADTVRQGEEIEVTVTVENRRGWPIPWIFVEDVAPPGFPVSGMNSLLAVLMPGRTATLNYQIRCTRRGYHRVGPLLMESGDLFGLQKRFRTGKRQDYVSVLPTVAYIDTFSISARRPQGPVRISNRVYEDPTRIATLREYVPGDPFNRIHWKASARTGDLYVKQNEPSTVLGATLILDLFGAWYQGETAEARLELAITTTASIAHLLQMSGEQLGMVTNARDAAETARYEVAESQTLSRQDADDSIQEDLSSDLLSPLETPTRRSPIQARTIIENLARVLPSDGLDVAHLILNTFRRLPRDAALIPVVPTVTDDLALTLGAMKLSGFPVTVFLIANNANYPEAVRLLAAHDIDVIHIEHERDLHELSPDRIGR